MFGLPVEVILGVVSGVGGFVMKYMAQKRANQHELLKLSIQRNESSSKLADAAVKRSSPFVRKTIAFFIIGVCFGGILLVSFFPDIDTNIFMPKEQKSFLGIFKWGKTYELVTVSGLIFPTWVKYSIITIIGFLFGTGASKITSN